MKKILTILLCVACLCANAQSGQTITAYIKAVSGANLRYQDSINGEVIRVIPFGEQIKILGTANNFEWFKAEYNGDRGFVSKTVLGSAQDIEKIINEQPLETFPLERYNGDPNGPVGPPITKKEMQNDPNTYLVASIEDLRTNCLFGGGSVVIRYTNNTPYVLQSAMVYVSIWRENKEILRHKELIRFENIPAYGSATQSLTFERGCEVEITQGARECKGLGINTYPRILGDGR